MSAGFLSQKDICTLLQISLSTLWRLRKETGFPAPIRIGRGVRWGRESIDAWLERQSVSK